MLILILLLLRFSKAIYVLNKNNEGLPMDVSVPLAAIAAFNSSYTGINNQSLFNVTYLDVFEPDHSNNTGYAEFSLVAAALPPHGSKLFRVRRCSTWSASRRGAPHRVLHEGGSQIDLILTYATILMVAWHCTGTRRPVPLD